MSPYVSSAISMSLGGPADELRERGFTCLEDVFTPEELREAESLLDDIVKRAESAPQTAWVGRFMRDMRAASPGTVSRPMVAWDQLEIDHAGLLQPALLGTVLFRKCAAMARGIAGRASYGFDHFICKPPHNGSETPWHQDAAFMRFQPSRARRLHFWVPFQDVSAENGCMRFVPGTHRLRLLPHEPFARDRGRPGWRGPPVDQDQAVDCPVRLGGLVIHTPYALHQAGRNGTGRPRKAWILQFSPWGGVQVGLKRRLRLLPPPLHA